MKIFPLILAIISLVNFPLCAQVSDSKPNLEPGKTAGIDAGIALNTVTGKFYVHGTSGSRTNSIGLYPGDVILKVDGIDVTGWSAEKMDNAINGKPGTDVVLWVRSVGNEEIEEVVITRGEMSGDMRAFFGESAMQPKIRVTEFTPGQKIEGNVSVITDENRAGLGAAVKLNEAGELEIVNVLADSGAEQAGMKKGDVILKVNGTDITRKPQHESASLIRGRDGSKVTLWIRAQGSSDIEEVVVTRKVIDRRMFNAKP